MLFAWLVTKTKFFTRTGLSKAQLVILFLLKVMAGIFYGWIGLYYGGMAQMSDTWAYNAASVHEYKLLLSDPGEYMSNLFVNPYEGGITNFLTPHNSLWNDLKGNMFIKILSLFNVFSSGNYYVNVIFYGFVTMVGPVAVFRVMIDLYPGRRNILLAAAFLVPSFLYWTSGLNKEGLIFTGIGLVVYAIYFSLKEKRFTIGRALLLLAGLLLVVTLRNFVVVLLLPAILAWVIAARKPGKVPLVFGALYLFYLLAFFTAKYVHPKFDFPQAVVIKQQQFLKLIGNSTIPIRELQPNAGSFLINTPQAINLSTIRPYPSDVQHILSLAAAIEVNVLLLMFVLFLFFRAPASGARAAPYFFVFFSFSLLLAIGFSVNNLGAIVRYRSVIISLLVVPMVARIDWDRINKLFFKNIINKNNINN